VLHFNAEHSIIIFSYLDDYRDLADFYSKEKVFPTQIVEAIARQAASAVLLSQRLIVRVFCQVAHIN
jgi:hypothetical protein